MDWMQKLETDITRALGVWAKRHNVRPIDFQSAMGWSYNYAWRVLRGKESFKPAAWGDFMIVYGMDSLREIFEIAEVDPNNIRRVDT